jgi:hypothetical protein
MTPRPRFTPGERTPGTHCTGGWVGPRAGLDAGAKRKILCPCRGSNLDRPIVQSVVRHYTAWATAAHRDILHWISICFLTTYPHKQIPCKLLSFESPNTIRSVPSSGDLINKIRKDVNSILNSQILVKINFNEICSVVSETKYRNTDRNSHCAFTLSTWKELIRTQMLNSQVSRVVIYNLLKIEHFKIVIFLWHPTPYQIVRLLYTAKWLAMTLPSYRIWKYTNSFTGY